MLSLLEISQNHQAPNQANRIGLRSEHSFSSLTAAIPWRHDAAEVVPNAQKQRPGRSSCHLAEVGESSCTAF